MTLLLTPRTSAERLERIADRPGIESTQAVSRVGRLDGRTRVIAVRDRSGWRPSSAAWTASTAESMRSGAVDEVLLRRRFRRARVLLAWLPRTARA